MKKSKLILTLALAVSFSFLLLSCGNNTKPNKDGATSNHDHSEMTHETDHSMTEDSGLEMSGNKTISNLIDNYLAIKNALVQDDSKAAGKAGQKLADNAAAFDVSSVDDSVQTEIKEILEVLKEHGEHIAKSEIDHQREHFEGIGVDFMDLIAITGTDRTLYQLYCPMYNNSKGGFWLSASTEIKNPLFGSKMLTCGSVSETISMK
jgi:hypothetical protein